MTCYCDLLLKTEPANLPSAASSPYPFRAWESPSSCPLHEAPGRAGRQEVGGKLRHRKATPHCTFCALEFHSPTHCPSLEEPVGMTCPPPRTTKRSKLDWGGIDWSQLRAGSQGLMLPPCKRALGTWLHKPWRMDMQPLCKSALILDYSNVHDLDMGKKKKNRKYSAPISVASGPAGGAVTHSHQLPPSR